MSKAATIEVRADLGVMPAQLRCLAAAIDPASTQLHRWIELDALDAFCEIQRMIDAARRAIGASPPQVTFEFRIQVDPWT